MLKHYQISCPLPNGLCRMEKRMHWCQLRLIFILLSRITCPVRNETHNSLRVFSLRGSYLQTRIHSEALSPEFDLEARRFLKWLTFPHIYQSDKKQNKKRTVILHIKIGLSQASTKNVLSTFRSKSNGVTRRKAKNIYLQLLLKFWAIGLPM